MLNCPVCDKEIPDDSKFCKECGYSFIGGSGQTGRLNPDTVLGDRYVIVKTLGQGGMGAVYLALDSRLNNSPVAIKEMSTRAVGGDLQAAIASFKKEAAILIGLRHPALPVVRDFFAKGEDRWYLVMDYIEGQTLNNIADMRGAIPEAEVLDWARQLCDILDYLHKQNPPIIFRDLKPANIMLTPQGQIKLIDFGIARHFRAGNTTDTSAYGSHGFAPPEQYGENQTSPASDIYGLGATLHFLLTGIDPGKNPFIFEPPSKYTKVTIRTETAVMKALDFAAENRPQNMQEMLALLTHGMSGPVIEGMKTTDPSARNNNTAANGKNAEIMSSGPEIQNRALTTPLNYECGIENSLDSTTALGGEQNNNALPSDIPSIKQDLKSTGTSTQKRKASGKLGNNRNILVVACIIVVLLISGAYGLSIKNNKNSILNGSDPKFQESQGTDKGTLKVDEKVEVSTKDQKDEKNIPSSEKGTDISISSEEENARPDSKIVFTDGQLEKGVRLQINKPQGDIYLKDINRLEKIELQGLGITNLSGLQYFTSLKSLRLDGNSIEDLSPLKNLTNLQDLDLMDNQIKDISPLRGLTNLQDLNLHSNGKVCDISPLRNLIHLKRLWLSFNEINDISPLENLTNLQELLLLGNPISDYSPTQSYYYNLEFKDFDL